MRLVVPLNVAAVPVFRAGTGSPKSHILDLRGDQTAIGRIASVSKGKRTFSLDPDGVPAMNVSNSNFWSPNAFCSARGVGVDMEGHVVIAVTAIGLVHSQGARFPRQQDKTVYAAGLSVGAPKVVEGHRGVSFIE
jgi:hypothetical protein